MVGVSLQVSHGVFVVSLQNGKVCIRAIEEQGKQLCYLNDPEWDQKYYSKF